MMVNGSSHCIIKEIERETDRERDRQTQMRKSINKSSVKPCQSEYYTKSDRNMALICFVMTIL